MFRLTVDTNGGSVQWRLNGVDIPGAISQQYYATQAGVYSVFLQDNGCSAESDPVNLKMGVPAAAVLTGNALISAGQTAQLPITFSGPAPWSFTLTSGQSVQNIYQNPYLLPVQPTNTTSYVLSAMSNTCGSGTLTSNAVVTVGSGSADVSLNMVASNRTPKVDEVIDYILTLTNDGPQQANGVQGPKQTANRAEFRGSGFGGDQRRRWRRQRRCGHYSGQRHSQSALSGESDPAGCLRYGRPGRGHSDARPRQPAPTQAPATARTMLP